MGDRLAQILLAGTQLVFHVAQVSNPPNVGSTHQHAFFYFGYLDGMVPDCGGFH